MHSLYDQAEHELVVEGSAARGPLAPPASVGAQGSRSRVILSAHGAASDCLLAELSAGLQWFEDVRVELRLHEETSALLLQEPRQRARLVGFLVEQARAFRTSGRPQLTLGWRDYPALVAVDSLRFVRVPSDALAGVDAPLGGSSMDEPLSEELSVG